MKNIDLTKLFDFSSFDWRAVDVEIPKFKMEQTITFE